MEKIYLNNYKGFKNQFIELGDINFLVGENSSGKTSLLQIINILSSSDFWFDFEFNNAEVELGYFDEIINKQSKQKSFQIGFEKEQKSRTNKKSEDSIFRILFNFKEKKSVPIISDVKVQAKKYNLHLKITKKQVEYKFKNTSNNSFEEWVFDSDFPSTRKRIRISRNQIPILFLVRYIEADLEGNNKSQALGPNFDQKFLFSRFKWIAQIRAKPKRIYEAYKIKFSPEGSHIPLLLKEILNSTNKEDRNEIISVIEKFGSDSSLFDDIEIKQLGDKDSSPFEIIIKYQNLEMKLPNVGYGVSQSLPLLIEILSSEKTVFSIQQPEVHLHPKAQAAFGSFLYDSIVNDSNRFIIETHSDYTINRFRYELLSSKNINTNIETKVLFFERRSNNNTITNINIEKNGRYTEKVPMSYRDFFIDEELKTLEL